MPPECDWGRANIIAKEKEKKNQGAKAQERLSFGESCKLIRVIQGTDMIAFKCNIKNV